MKRLTFSCALFTLFIGSTITPSVYAQENNPSTDPKITKKSLSDSKFNQFNRSRKTKQNNTMLGRKGPTNNPLLNSQLQWIDKLQKMIRKDLKLTTEQQNEIDQIMDNHVAMVLNRFHKVGLPKKSGNRLPVLGRNYNRSNDKWITKNKSKKEIPGASPSSYLRSGQEGIPELILYHMEELLDELRSAIPDEHREPLNNLIILWDITYYGLLPDGPLRRLNRIIKSPILKVSADKRQKLLGIMGNAMRELGPKGRRDKAKQRKAYEKLLEDVFRELTPEQQTKVTKTLQFVEEDARAMKQEKAKQANTVNKIDE